MCETKNRCLFVHQRQNETNREHLVQLDTPTNGGAREHSTGFLRYHVTEVPPIVEITSRVTTEMMNNGRGKRMTRETRKGERSERERESESERVRR